MEYISERNQKILWNSINKIKRFNSILDENYKKELFKYAIQFFYDNNKKRKLNQVELIEINKNTLLYVIQILSKECSEKNTTLIPRQTFENSFKQCLDIDLQEEELPINFENNYKKQSKQNAYSQEYLNRQKDYEIMLKKDVPTNEVLFENKIEDKAIDNMEELLQQQIKQRELEVQIINEEIKTKMENSHANDKVENITSNDDVFLKKRVSFKDKTKK